MISPLIKIAQWIEGGQRMVNKIFEMPFNHRQVFSKIRWSFFHPLEK